MPDCLTHVVFGLLLCEVFKIKHKSLVILGCLLPDIGNLFNLLTSYKFFWFLQPLSTPIGVILLSTSIGFLFNIEYKRAFSLLLLGAGSHLILDFTVRRFEEGILLLFPFSWKQYNPGNFGLFWPEQFYLPLFFSIILLSIYKFRTYAQRKAKKPRDFKRYKFL